MHHLVEIFHPPNILSNTLIITYLVSFSRPQKLTAQVTGLGHVDFMLPPVRERVSVSYVWPSTVQITKR